MRICLVQGLDWIERFILSITKVAAWLIPCLVFVIVLQVALRYGFSSGIAALEELQWHLYGATIMFGIVYSQIKGTPIRTDVLRDKFSPRKKAIIDFLGMLFLMMPFLFIALDHSIDFWYESFRLNERSDSPQGLPYRWIIKGTLPICFFLMLVSCISHTIKNAITILETTPVNTNSQTHGR